MLAIETALQHLRPSYVGLRICCGRGQGGKARSRFGLIAEFRCAIFQDSCHSPRRPRCVTSVEVGHQGEIFPEIHVGARVRIMEARNPQKGGPVQELPARYPDRARALA